MGILDFIKSVFQPVAAPQVATSPPTDFQLKLASALNDYREVYIARHLIDIELEAASFAQHYGPDFNAFLYRLDATDFIRQQVVEFRTPSGKFNHFLDNSHWANKHYLNFPGPFYTGESDTCGTGDGEAPHNVLLTDHAEEYVFRQPQNFSEFLCVLDAAAVEVLDSYSCDGNRYWTVQLCREWWRSKPRIIRILNKPAFQKHNGSRNQLYLDYLNGAAETDLRKYCYFLENGVYPSAEVSNLPLL